MSDSSQNPSYDEHYEVSMEKENRSLHRDQVRRINDAMRKVSRISRDSKQFVRDATSESPVADTDTPGAYIESPGTVERIGPSSDETGQFCLPEPGLATTVGDALDRAFLLAEKERKEFKSNSGSPVIKRWKIL